MPLVPHLGDFPELAEEVYLAPTAHVGTGGEAEDAGSPEGVDGAAGEGAGLIDLIGLGRDDVVDDARQRVQVV